MHAERVAVRLDVLGDVLRSLLPRFAILPLRQLLLQRLEERFRHRVVQRRAGHRRGLNDVTGARTALESLRGVLDALDALLGVKSNSRARSAFL